MPRFTASATRGAKASLPGWPMISMQAGEAASASRKCFSITSGCHPEYCSESFTPNAAAAARAPLVRGRVEPSPGLPPIWKYMVMPAPSGSSA